MTQVLKSLPTIFSRQACLVAAWISLILAVIGVFVPLLPTVPFLLCGFWFSNKAGSGLSRRLRQHRKFGPTIDNWQKQRSLAVSTKWLATTMLLLNWIILFYFEVSNMALATTALVFGFMLIYIHRLPSMPVTNNE